MNIRVSTRIWSYAGQRSALFYGRSLADIVRLITTKNRKELTQILGLIIIV